MQNEQVLNVLWQFSSSWLAITTQIVYQHDAEPNSIFRLEFNNRQDNKIYIALYIMCKSKERWIRTSWKIPK